MKKEFFRYWCSLGLLLTLLLAACGGGGGDNGEQPTKQPQVTPTVPQTATTEPVTSCPARLKEVRTCLTPYTLRQVYGVQSLIDKGYTGKGQTVVLIESFGSPTIKEDTDAFSKTFGLPPADIEVILPLNVPEKDPHNDKYGWMQETTLDVQIVHSIAPEAKIVILVSPVAETQGTFGLPEYRQLEQYILDHKLGNIVSQSWGASELTLQDKAARDELNKWDALLKKGALEHHITYLSSSGDSGATDYIDQESTRLGDKPTTVFSASNPWGLAVGGTTVLPKKSGGYTERAWNGSGGGFSSIFALPEYQKKLPAQVQQMLQNRRGVPDVSANADPATGLAYYLKGNWSMAGGTSASAPLWAGLIAIANQMAGKPLGFINPALYQLATTPAYNQCFHDITTGDNTNREADVEGYPAMQGWDPVTGLGTPNAEKLLPELIKIQHA
uniref:Peptidase S53 domain-containing protein n=1 Tax=Thermosporothrix sp. COM3 TaxID=2490863 RepID=A0A455SVG4_9CHLR|nr:hypothetical protein KTC_38750 [Thermosporothrix sp. COM3]